MYKVLVVEDEERIRKGLLFLTDWLKAGCAVAGEAADGQEGLRLIEQLSPDIVIADVKMPFLDGISMLEAAQKKCAFEAIVLSGYSEFTYAQKAVSLGVTEYLLKPLDFKLLYRALEKSCAKRAAARQAEALRAAAQTSRQEPPRLPARSSKYTARLLERIQSSYAEKLSLSGLSEEYGVSATHLNAQFKKETGSTFNDFLNRFRIQRAAELLQSGRLKVYEAAEAVGFADYKYFTQVFKKYAGCPPGHFNDKRD